ncbi:MarR family winged helix-turn-helix transcriptional regulator [Isoptericola aurantiacus]|uniref:MarR family winged helix-turn-helix transcriptional regulator n=1 Tax=Isoptericola aurantiacus TaxID=3377839 RepID=UPI00383A7DB6
MADDSDRAGEPYWYEEQDDEGPRRLLQALRTFRRADETMRRRAGRDMDMNLTDLRALRHVIAAQRHGEAVTPRSLASDLEISTASTTKLLDRLSDSGRLERRPHPRDRRSVVVVATDAAHAEVRERLTGVHDRMLAVAREVPEHCRPAVRAFLLAMADSVEETPDGAAGTVAVDDAADPAAGGPAPAPPR